MKLKLLAGAALAAAFAASGASAQEGWYGAVDLGYHWPDSIEARRPTTRERRALRLGLRPVEDDWTGFARLGYQFTPHWRVELEVGYRAGDIESVRGGRTSAVVGLCTPGVIRTAAPGLRQRRTARSSRWTSWRNVIYDILPGSVINPFIGVGIGVEPRQRWTRSASSRTSRARSRAANPAIQNLTIDDDDTAFAYQAHRRPGLEGHRPAERRPDLPLPRRRRTSTSRLDAAPARACSRACSRGEYKDQSVTLGLRYSFAAPPPPAAAAAAAAASSAPAAASPAAAASAAAGLSRPSSSSSTSRSISTS